EIEHSFADEWPAVGDAHNGRGAGFCVRDAHDAVQRQRAMCGGHLIHVIDFAIRAAPVVVGRTVPARKAGLAVDRLFRSGEWCNDLGWRMTSLWFRYDWRG